MKRSLHSIAFVPISVLLLAYLATARDAAKTPDKTPPTHSPEVAAQGLLRHSPLRTVGDTATPPKSNGRAGTGAGEIIGARCTVFRGRQRTSPVRFDEREVEAGMVLSPGNSDCHTGGSEQDATRTNPHPLGI